MMLGLWKNIEELEMYLTIDELELILSEARRKEREHQKFLAALQGVNLDAAEDDGVDRVEAAKRRIAAQQAGKPEAELEYNEISLDYEIEE